MSMLPPRACRLRVCYRKDGRLAYLGHLEVMNTVMRCIRRAGIPFEVGNGFARRMRIQFTQALPVGASSEGEYFDLLLSEPCDPAKALSDLRKASPRALAPIDARILPRRIASLEAWINLSRWEVALRGEGVDAQTFMEGLDRVKAAGAIDYMRGDKPRHLNVEGLVGSCEARAAEGGVDLMLETRNSPAGALRPAVLVNAAVGCAPLRVCRVAQWHEDDDGVRHDPFDVQGA